VPGRREPTRHPGCDSSIAVVTTGSQIVALLEMSPMTKLLFVGLTTILGVLTTFVVLGQTPPPLAIDPSDPRSPAAIVKPDAAGKDTQQDLRDKDTDSGRRHRPGFSDPEPTRNDALSPRAPASDGSGKN
jgi:hypothetical protein